MIKGIIRCVALCAAILAAGTVVAQGIQLSPDQQRMLDQLPPAQRQQAMDAIQQVQARQTVSGQVAPEARAPLSPELSPVLAAEPVGEIARAGARSRLVISLEPKGSLTEEELEDLKEDPALVRLSGSQNYVLDESGVLSLLGIQSIPLLGLTEPDIERRLGAEPLLAAFDIDARLLESQPTGAEALRPFGYDIFEPKEAGFDPPMTGPVPPDYVLGPGDSVRVQFFGNVNGIYEVEVTRDGILNLPEIGPITVAGLPFSDFRSDVDRRVAEMLIGTQVSVTMGTLRTIRIFVLGDANRPGSYVVDSLATISSALYRSGGISRIGTLRDIQLKRQGRIVARLDLYDLLLKGDTSGDSRLQPGDVIFIPPIGTQVSVTGAVKRPAIYETKSGSSVADVVGLAGGFLAEAFPDGARIERIEEGVERIVISIDADGRDAGTTTVKAGDLLLIPSVLPEFEDIVSLTGHVHRPGPYQWRNGMRLTDVIGSVFELKPGADTGYVLIRREDPEGRQVTVVSVSLEKALENRAAADNIRLQARDTIHVFSMAFGRQRVITPILEELQLQSRFGKPYREVSVSGQVKATGRYPMEDGMRITDLLRAGGGLNEQAYTLNAEIARYEIQDGSYRVAEVIDVDLAAALAGDSAADLLLQEHDNLRINRVPEWDALATVDLDGEVVFPGEYRIRMGETLGSVLRRAGGLTAEAFPKGAIFLRETLRQREQEQMDMLAVRLESDLASLSLQDGSSIGNDTLPAGRALLSQLRETRAVGRLVIELDQVAADSEEFPGADIVLKDGDRLLVPKVSQEVTVLGETQQQVSHLYRPGMRMQDYIDMSGGLTRRADRRLIYIVRASGAVVARPRSRWLGRAGGAAIEPGDTIVVPIEIDRIRPLTLWTNVMQIVYQAAIAVAAVDTFRD